MTVHHVKSWPYLFAAAITGLKTHDIRRRTERDYRVGDTLVLQEWSPPPEVGTEGRYTGREQAFEITYITSVDHACAFSPYALDPDYCILSISKVDP